MMRRSISWISFVTIQNNILLKQAGDNIYTARGFVTIQNNILLKRLMRYMKKKE